MKRWLRRILGIRSPSADFQAFGVAYAALVLTEIQYTEALLNGIATREARALRGD